MRDSFVFYGSFYEALSEIDDDSVRLAVYDAVAGYALTGIVPELSGTASALFKLMMPVIDANNKRRDAGAKGGASKTEANVKQTPSKAEANTKQNEANEDEDKDEDGDEDIYTAVVTALNETAGTNYSPKSDKTRKLIDARVREGYSLDDFRKVIDIKCAEWKGTDMAKFLRPETLFSNKFEGYLNQPRARNGGRRMQEFDERTYESGEMEGMAPNALDALMAMDEGEWDGYLTTT